MWTKPLRSRAIWMGFVRPVFCSAPIAAGDSSAITSRL
jgi:hypothetical protein